MREREGERQRKKETKKEDKEEKREYGDKEGRYLERRERVSKDIN